MGAIITHRMTFEEFERLPETGPFYYELRHGELVQVPRPKHKHYLLQEHFVILLRALCGEIGHVGMEVSFRARPEYEFRVADVAYVSRERWEQIDPEDYLHGAPELVIEILSPSNTMAEILDKKELCLENGSREFWVVDQNRRKIEVSTPDGITTAYRTGQEIPLRLFGAASLSVDAVFS